MEKETLRPKFLGSLIGTAVGDALGAGFEGHLWVDQAEVYAEAERRHILIYTDDTHMMIGVAESLIEKRGFDGEHMTCRFMENYRLESYRGYGPGPPQVFRLIERGETWDKAAEKIYGGGSFGNGSAMRVAPVGLFYYDDPPQLREIAYQSSQITHAHELGKEGAALQAYAVALATAADPSSEFSRGSFLTKLYDFTQYQVFKSKVKRIGELWGEKDKSKIVAEVGHGIEAFNSVPAAIYSFLHHPDSFEKTVIYAISLGGDTDTIGAMAGAISGAYLGVEAIPAKWQTKLENKDYIQDLAEQLWRLKA
jgi:poly(ADP-ribose) glycohydrolase ARH3